MNDTNEFGINLCDVVELINAGILIEPISMSDFSKMTDAKVSIDDIDPDDDGDIIYLLFEFLEGYERRIVVLPGDKVNLLDEIAFATENFKKEQQC